ncbi:MAG TPA: response regulator transcription factor [Solirubrobacteraceae bacterium]|jgi:DNA-binding NarL/FixJ family response regulator|nr:response regulator transcription factor [Solirubrobacteraceae bacterium]
MGQAIRVVVGEDNPLFQAGVVHVLEEAGLDVVAVANDATDLVRQVQAHRPDVALIDIKLPPDLTDDGLRAARELRSSAPTVRILLLSQLLADDLAIDLIGDRPGGVGYLLKDRIADAASFVDAVRRVAGGESVIDREIVVRLIGHRRRHSIDDLTAREREVLALMAEGQSNRGIARELFVTVSAVERHVTRIFTKLGLPPEPQSHRRVLAVLRFLHR